jgi:predicted aspartyl protease
MTKVIIYCVIAIGGVLAACDAPETTAGEATEATIKGSEASDMTLDELLTQNQEYERIPLKKMSSGHLQMQVSLNGVPGKFILDTGAGATVLEEKKKSNFHLKAIKTNNKVTGTGGGAMSMQLSSGNLMKIGQMEIENSSIYLMSLDHVNDAFLTMKLDEVDGIIGADVLSSKKGVIDYSNLILYLRK